MKNLSGRSYGSEIMSKGFKEELSILIPKEITQVPNREEVAARIQIFLNSSSDTFINTPLGSLSRILE